MEIVYDEKSLQDYISRATELTPDHPVLVDRFLEDAVEIDVDALCDGDEVFIGGVMEHIEEAASTPATRRARCRRSPWAAPTCRWCASPPRRWPRVSA